MTLLVARFRYPLFMAALLALAALACNAPGREATPRATPPSTNTSSPGVVATSATLAPGETVPSEIATAESLATSPAQPTFTPIQAPTLAPTLRPTNTRPRATPPSPTKPSGTDTPDLTQGSLEVSYYIEWRLKDASAKQAIATMTITARGGGGNYRYFHDEIALAGPVFEFDWATCRPKPGSVRVNSANGQSITLQYFEHPPCPTPTPTP